MKNTIAEEFNHNFDDGPFRLYDNRANNIYYETLNNFWTKRKFDNKSYYDLLRKFNRRNMAKNF